MIVLGLLVLLAAGGLAVSGSLLAVALLIPGLISRFVLACWATTCPARGAAWSPSDSFSLRRSCPG
jgi:hypothetical protein